MSSLRGMDRDFANDSGSLFVSLVSGTAGSRYGCRISRWSMARFNAADFQTTAHRKNGRIRDETMRLREKPIYLSNEVWRALWILAKADKATASASSLEVLAYKAVTPDEIADDMLRQAIREQHPELIMHLEKMDTLEKQLIEKLRKK